MTGQADFLLPHLPRQTILAAFAAAPGDEIGSGKLNSPESSAALVANAFGIFLDRSEDLPPLCAELRDAWPAIHVQLEAQLRFPWSGGRHPWLDVLVESETHLIGIESKRYEPFRGKSQSHFSDAYFRDVWGESMRGFCEVRDRIADGSLLFKHLDAAQLVKHAFGLRTAVHQRPRYRGKRGILVYLYAEPARWSGGAPISLTNILRHRSETQQLARMLSDDEITFLSINYSSLLDTWLTSQNVWLSEHAAAVRGLLGRCHPWEGADELPEK